MVLRWVDPTVPDDNLKIQSAETRNKEPPDKYWEFIKKGLLNYKRLLPNVPLGKHLII